ncbi:MFS transporter [Marinifaba aquimaris]|uniref:MFS transporter n=1 Tax=Marinifaba aquimaris TaxID=2741323 RepID=UPI0031B5B0BA
MSNQLNAFEKKIAATLASVFGLRMLGLFMVMPVVAVFGQDLEGFSPIWIGIIVGAYGLTQALLQIPMGLLSDKIGRKPVILLGLSLFALGSIIAANADHVIWVTVGRFLQGTGAIAAAVLALAADLTREEQRSKVMAIIGMCIGLSFAIAMVAGPLIANKLGLSGIFAVTAVLACIGIAIVAIAIPNTVNKAKQRDAIPIPSQLKQLAKHSQLGKLNLGVFFLHLQLTALFVILPGLLVQSGMASQSHWMLYFPALIMSFIIMAPALMWAVKNNKEVTIFKLAIAVMALSLITVAIFPNALGILLATLVLFFAGFNYLEANLPAWVSRIAPAGQKGSAMGLFSTHQFAGAFAGGLVGGVLLQMFSAPIALAATACLALPWFFLMKGLVLPRKTKPRVVSFKATDVDVDTLANNFTQISGVEEAVIFVEDQKAYLKIDPKCFEESDLTEFLKQHKLV